MNKLLLGAVVVGTVALGAPAASADPGHSYTGGCGLWSAQDPTPNQVLGGNGAWVGVVYLNVTSNTSTAATDSIYVRCDVYENGVLIVHDAVSASGTATVAAARQIVYVAQGAVTLCEYVAVASYPVTYHGC